MSNDMIKKIHALESDFHNTLTTIKESFNDHLDTINENTQEIESNAEHLHAIEQKIEKLHTRMDSMHMMFKQIIMQSRVSVELNLDEQRVFSLLSCYKNYVKMKDVVERTRLSKQDINDIITSLMDKGIPVVRRSMASETFLRMDPEFSALQERQQIIKISPAVHQQFANQSLGSFL